MVVESALLEYLCSGESMTVVVGVGEVVGGKPTRPVGGGIH